jgi:hypothetical protein
VARIAEIFFEVDGGVAERGLGLAAGLAHQRLELVLDWHTFMPRPPPPDAALMMTG